MTSAARPGAEAVVPTVDVLPVTAQSSPRSRAGLKIFLVSLALAAPAGAGWWLLAPLPRFKLDPRGLIFVGSQTETAIAADAWFGASAAVAGGLCGAVAFRMSRANPRVLIGLTLGGLIGAVAAWRFGAFLGPAPVEVQTRALSVGDELDGPLELSALGVLFTWPMAAVIVYFSLVAGLEAPPRAAPARRARDNPEDQGVLTPDDVARKQFTTTRLRPGYDEAEVDEFLEHVVVELRRLHQDIYALRAREATAARMASAARRRKDQSVMTADDVTHKQFTTTRLRPGYDEAEVDQFLERVVVELRRLQQDVDALRASPDGSTAGDNTPQRAPQTAPSPPNDDAARQWLNPTSAAPAASPSHGGALRRVVRRLLGREEGKPS